jgi:cytochrome c-type biogenesis protein CcmF
MLKIWNILLILLTFLLGIFGTFLTRSGIVNSVHAFADSNLGRFFLGYMILVVFATLYLIADRRELLKSERSLDSVLSKESAFLFNNFILIVSCFAVFWGTMFPVLSEWIKGTKITVGSPFFNNVIVPVGLILLFLTGAGPLFAWRKTSLASLKKSFAWPVVFSAAIGIALLAGGMRSFYSLVCLSLCAFVTVTIIEEFYKGARVRVKSKGEHFFSAALNLTLRNKRRYGGYIIHLSIALMFVGFAGNAFNRETTQRLATGQEMSLGGYSLKMTGYHEGETPNYEYGYAVLEVYRDGKLVRTLKPERRFFKTGNQQSTTIVALHSTPREDLYVLFSGMTDDAKAEIAAHINPLVFWIWAGSAIMVFGAIVTMLPDKGSR